MGEERYTEEVARGEVDGITFICNVMIPDISIAVVGSPSPSEKCKSPTENLAPGTNTGWN